MPARRSPGPAGSRLADAAKTRSRPPRSRATRSSMARRAIVLPAAVVEKSEWRPVAEAAGTPPATTDHVPLGLFPNRPLAPVPAEGLEFGFASIGFKTNDRAAGHGFLHHRAGLGATRPPVAAPHSGPRRRERLPAGYRVDVQPSSTTRIASACTDRPNRPGGRSRRRTRLLQRAPERLLTAASSSNRARRRLVRGLALVISRRGDRQTLPLAAAEPQLCSPPRCPAHRAGTGSSSSWARRSASQSALRWPLAGPDAGRRRCSRGTGDRPASRIPRVARIESNVR